MGGAENVHYSDGNVVGFIHFCGVRQCWVVPLSAWFTANRRLWEGDELTQTAHETAVLCGELKATFGPDLVCAEVQQVKTMYCESWL